MSKPVSWFLVAFGVWSWFIWPNFLRNIWSDPRSFDDGPQAFFLVHLVLVVVSLVFGTAIAVIGVRGVRGARRRSR
ncbi:SCO4848 family membrane protein [Kineococcus halophytocola]